MRAPALLTLLGLLLLPVAGEAQGVRFQAAPAPVHFTHQRQAFSSWGFDTGWWPSSGPIQVRFVGDLGGGFSASAPGLVRLGWHPQRSMWTEGDSWGGTFQMNVGAELQSRMKIDIQVPGGSRYTWEGNIPYFPNFDYRFFDQQPFTPFLLAEDDPADVQLRDAIQRTRLASVPLTQAILPIPGVGGFLNVDAGGILDASLRGRRLVFPEASISLNGQFISWWLPIEPLL
jgi:hypothetical protein